jgi:uncharacterized membrane protein YwaF
MPVLVAVTQSTFGGLVHIFWPGSLVLMSLGAEPSSTTRVIGIWGVAVLSNVLLYMVLGLVAYYFIRFLKRSRNESAKAP